MNYSCVLVDDEPLARKVLRDYLEDIGDFYVLSESKNAIEAQRIIDSHSVDVLFLDINMPKISGIDWMKGLNRKPKCIIFTTAYSEFAVDAFELEAFDYLVKPIALNRFLKTISKVRTQLQQYAAGAEVPVRIKEGKRLYRVLPNEIFYLQAYGDYVKIYTTHKVFVVKQKLSSYTSVLSERFLQVHRSFIVNIECIEYIEGNHVVINQEKIPVSESFRDKLNSFF